MLIVIFFPGRADELYIIRFKVGSLEEAKKAIHAGVDAIIVQGREAGGHVIGQVSLLSWTRCIEIDDFTIVTCLVLCLLRSLMAYCLILVN